MSYAQGYKNTDIQRLWERLDAEERQLKLEKKKLREIWVKISKMHKKNEEARSQFEKDSMLTFVPEETQVMLNVGGQVFQTTAGVLCKDKFSILAALCTQSPPLEQDDEGVFFVERDWWVFRYILQFLRNDSLPRDSGLLEEMYTEASFYRLNSLRRAIEVRCSTLTVKTTTQIEGPGGGGGGLLQSKGGVRSSWPQPYAPLGDPFNFASSQR
ncbi:hypothetical protein TrVE_jg7749 [Triparma verrucosa]|uniref:BTB domain-containing protein n=2 Tax=Triparma TaxID=722752 RepID=A0A9W7BVQ5_9STRA|nr:hypothetical protein TrVE_jg7749 [Triparma verrucosa]GMH97266.1 hypothetical protein TrST_g3761 [Triparma strigata]